MADIEQLIRLNIELEGLLKVLVERDNIHARSMLAEKIENYYKRVNEYLAGGKESQGATESLAEEGSDLRADADRIEVKDQEAVENEVEDETDAATEAIERGEEEAEHHDIDLPQVKDEEAVENEVEDETDAATEAIERGEEEYDVREKIHIEAPATEPNDKLIKAFTLNDKFRFRRDLFNGDADDFDQTLALLAQMPSYTEAEDYLYNDLMWDPKRQDVADFMAILKENMHP